MIMDHNELPIEFNDRALNTVTEEELEEIRSGYVPEEDNSPLLIAPSERRLVTQPYDFNVKTIVSQIDDDTLNVRPQYQRGYVWDDSRASRLIESLLMNIPIPACYFAEEETGIFTVIDGQQRLYSIQRYVKDQFKLKNLNTLPELNGNLFSDLPVREQRLIMGRFIRCIVITQESHPEIRFEVFERLNTGAMQLTDQEIRNAVYRGEINELIRDLANQPRWIHVLSKKQLDTRMRDDELVLRFFAVHENYLSYDAPLRSFLNKYMASKRDKRNKLDPTEKQRLQALFEQTVDKVINVFDGHAFRIYSDGWEKQVNRALFDAVMLVFSQLPMEELVNQSEGIHQALIDLCQNRTFFQVTARATASRNSFFDRIRMFSEAMASVGLDSGIHQSIHM